MNAKEFYKHITEHMTAEEALLKLLEGHVRTYEKLKFPEGEELHPVMVATMAAVDMGWVIAIPASEEDEEVRGIVMGTQEYVEEMLTGPEDKEGCGCANGCASDKCDKR